MLLYTHLALARVAQTRIQPAYLNEFAWGTVIPDIYGLAEIPRNQAHFTREGLERLMARFPEQRSFVQGYRVHLLLDELDQNKIIFQSVPSAYLRGLFFDSLPQ